MSLPVPPYMTNHGETWLLYHADTGGNDAWEAKCKRHYTRSGPLFRTEAPALKWQCPRCLKEASYHEIATRDD